MVLRRLVRIGVPVTWNGFAGKYCPHSAKPKRTVSASFALIRFAFPGIAFDSWINVGVFSKRPARIGAVEVNPPIPSTADGRQDRNRFKQVKKPPTNFAAKGKICGDQIRGIPIDAIFLISKSVRSRTAIASICFSEIKSNTSWPRARRSSATANPGNR